MTEAAAAAPVEGNEGGGAKETFKDLFAGAAGGVAQVLIGEFFLLCFFSSSFF